MGQLNVSSTEHARVFATAAVGHPMPLQISSHTEQYRTYSKQGGVSRWWQCRANSLLTFHSIWYANDQTLEDAMCYTIPEKYTRIQALTVMPGHQNYSLDIPTVKQRGGGHQATGRRRRGWSHRMNMEGANGRSRMWFCTHACGVD